MKIVWSYLLLLISMTALADSDLTLDLKPNISNFTVVLDANPTTGYQWTVSHYDHKLLTAGKGQYQAAQTHLIGAGGKMIFPFSFKKLKKYPKCTVIEFKYARPWEAQHATTKKVKVRIQ